MFTVFEQEKLHARGASSVKLRRRGCIGIAVIGIKWRGTNISPSFSNLFQESASEPAKECLRIVRRLGRTPNLKCADLAVRFSRITPYRAEIEWYKGSCDKSDEKLGYYDAFKQRGSSKRGHKVNMNRHKLLHFGMAMEERRFEIFDRWWTEKRVNEEKNSKRIKFAGLTQDSCFWNKEEEARECVANVRSESDARKQALLWDSINNFEMYAARLVERKEVSEDVVAKNSSYKKLLEELTELRSAVHPFWTATQFPSLRGGEVVP
ncbi:hypothetical protein ACE6H2_015282 [Prunus campanulata]